MSSEIEEVKNPIIIDEVHKKRITAKAFYLHIRDLIPDEKRDIDKIVYTILSKINFHKRSAAKFDADLLIFT